MSTCDTTRAGTGPSVSVHARKSRGRQPSIPELIEALVDPRLSGAACAGRAPMFDDEIPGEIEAEQSRRLSAAAAVCIRCPVRSACRTAASELDHLAGVWAGNLTHPSRLVGRPRKDLSA